MAVCSSGVDYICLLLLQMNTGLASHAWFNIWIVTSFAFFAKEVGSTRVGMAIALVVVFATPSKRHSDNHLMAGAQEVGQERDLNEKAAGSDEI